MYKYIYVFVFSELLIIEELLTYRIKENSWVCWIGRKYMKCNALAMVIGNTIHLSGVTMHEFLKDEKWLRHELVHIKQFHELGEFKFFLVYLSEWIKKGYNNNKLEIEARELKDDIALDNFHLQLPNEEK